MPDSTQDKRDQHARVLVLLVWAWAVLPRLVQTVTAPKVHQSVEQAAVPYTHLASLLVTATSLLLGGYCAFVIATSLARLPRSRFTQLAALLLPWLWLVVRGLYIPITPTRNTLVFPLVAVTMWVLRPRLRTLQTLGLLVGFTAVASIVIGIALPSHGIFRLATGDFATEDKQVLRWGILVGVFTQGNNLSQFMVLGMPALGMIQRRSTRRALTGLAAFATVWGASRSCMAALGMIIVTYALVRLSRGGSRLLIGACCIAISFGVLVAMPLLPHQTADFSNRGYIWTQSLRVVQHSFAAGLGANWYSQIASTSGALGPTVFHGHNQFIQLLVTGGIVLVIAVGLMVLVLSRSALSLAAQGEPSGVLFLVALAGAGLMEVSLVFVDNFVLAPVVIIPLCYIAFASPERPAIPDRSSDDAASPCPESATSRPLLVGSQS